MQIKPGPERRTHDLAAHAQGDSRLACRKHHPLICADRRFLRDAFSLEVQAIADGEVAVGIVGLDPIANGQVTRQEIERCEKDEAATLRLLSTPDLSHQKAKGARYTPVSKRQDKPDAIAWLLKHHPEVSDAQLCKLIGTTKDTIAKVRDRSHWNATNIKPRNPVTLGLCTEADLEKVVVLARPRGGRLTTASTDDPEAPQPE